MDSRTPGVSAGFSWRMVFVAFRSRNYRLYFLGQGLSLVGTWMQQVAMGWLVYRLTRSSLMLGLVGFVSLVPTMLLTPLAGVVADRRNRYRIMIWVQVLELLEALLLSILVLTGVVRIWHILVLGAFLGTVNAFDAPARHSFVVQLVEHRRDLPNAIALNSAMFNSARLIGPVFAGFLIKLTGEGICFLLNAFSYLAVIVALLAMRIGPQPGSRAQRRSLLFELREGVAYTFGIPSVRLILLHFATVAMLGMSFTVLMPVLATEVLHGGPGMLGLLTGAMGAGAVIGAVFLAARGSSHGLGRLIAWSSGLFGVGLAALSFSRIIPLSLLLMVAVGLGMTAQMTLSNTYLQTVVDDDKRSRVMAFYLLSFFGTIPFGHLLTGALAHLLGVPSTLLLGATASLISTYFFHRRFRAIHPKE